jgi:hypothetical protein
MKNSIHILFSIGLCLSLTTAHAVSSFPTFSVSNVFVLPAELLNFQGQNIDAWHPTEGTEKANWLTWTSRGENRRD